MANRLETLQGMVSDMWDEAKNALRVVLKESSVVIGATRDAGPSWVVTRTYTTSADMQTAAALTAAPTFGQCIVLDDILISTDTAMLFEIEMETSTNVLAAVRLPANGTVQLTFRDGLKGDVVNKKIYGDAGAAGNVHITAAYHSEVI